MTKPDEIRHETSSQVSDRQIAAIATLINAGTQDDAAIAAGVSRQTVNKWVNHHYGFISMLNRLRAERLQTCADQLQKAVLLALKITIEHLEQGDPLAANSLLKLVGVDHLVTLGTNLPTKPESVRGYLIEQEYDSFLEAGRAPDFISTAIDKAARRSCDTN